MTGPQQHLYKDPFSLRCPGIWSELITLVSDLGEPEVPSGPWSLWVSLSQAGEGAAGTT